MQGLVAIVVLLALAVAAPAAAAKGRVLATGDSMIQLVDHALDERLPRGVRVRSDAHIGTGLSKPFMLNWPRHAKRTARSYRPRASVVFLGANDGFPLRYKGRRVDCCSRRWSEAYAAQARRMMRALSRKGRSRVYWLTLPAARPNNFNRVFRRVNRGLEIAAKGKRKKGIRLVDLRPIFTPNGYRSSIRRSGRRVTVRQSDGIHLNVRGASIAARRVARLMRRDGLFKRRW